MAVDVKQISHVCGWGGGLPLSLPRNGNNCCAASTSVQDQASEAMPDP